MASLEVSSDAITFVSGNSGKIKEVEAIMKDSDIELRFEKLDLPEIQGDPDFICETKCKAAASLVKGPVVVEDTSLCFNAIHGFPGPYIKWFYESLGSDGLLKLLTGFKDKTAFAVCIFGFTEGPGKEIYLFHGETKGKIVPSAGDQGFGWDSCFQPDGMNKTYAQLSSEEKNEISHRYQALVQLKHYLTREWRKTKQEAKQEVTV